MSNINDISSSQQSDVYIYHNTEKKYITKDISVTFVYSDDMTNEDIIQNINETLREAENVRRFNHYTLDILEVWKDYEEI
tara:strand:+ start:336 stop:575 length:240 start_codon:yes stop_codon:yes gene_type:complete